VLHSFWRSIALPKLTTQWLVSSSASSMFFSVGMLWSKASATAFTTWKLVIATTFCLLSLNHWNVLIVLTRIIFFRPAKSYLVLPMFADGRALANFFLWPPTTHAIIANSASGEVVTAYRYFVQKRAASPLSLLENKLVTVALCCPPLAAINLLQFDLDQPRNHLWYCYERQLLSSHAPALRRPCFLIYTSCTSKSWWCLPRGVTRGARGAQFPGRRVNMGRRKLPTMSQVLPSTQYICFRKTSGSNMGAPNLLLAPDTI